MSRNTKFFWIRSVIACAYESATDDDFRTVKTHGVRKTRTSFLFKKNCAVQQLQQVLKAETWSSQMTFSAFYLRVATHRFMDIFSINFVVVA